MSISISNDGRYTSLTWKSAFIYEWKECEGRPWLLRMVKSIAAFVRHKDMKSASLSRWLKKHSSRTLIDERNVALQDRRVRLCAIRQEKKTENRQKRGEKWNKKRICMNKGLVSPEEKAEKKQKKAKRRQKRKKQRLAAPAIAPAIAPAAK